MTTLTPNEKTLADANQKIAAIKALRERTGLGLREAKDVVDLYMEGEMPDAVAGEEVLVGPIPFSEWDGQMAGSKGIIVIFQCRNRETPASFGNERKSPYMPDNALKQFFSPCLTLFWRGKFGKFGKAFYPDKVEDRNLLIQFCQEAGFPGRTKVTPEMHDALLAAAGKHGWSIETIGGEDE